MATVTKENNILKIVQGSNNYYFNAAWCTIDFANSTVIITDEGRGTDNQTSIAFSDFTDGTTSYNTEEDIVNYLSDKIG